MRTKDHGIETLRGLAVVLMVAAHVVGGSDDRGMAVASDSHWRWVSDGLADLRMPLFTVLSGFVYAVRPLVSADLYPTVVRGKARRLLVPLVTVGTLFFLLQAVVPGTNSTPALTDVWQVYVLGYGHLWFVQALFLIFLVVGALDLTGVLARPGGWGSVLVLSAAGAVLISVSGPWGVFSAGQALDLLPFFLLGYGLRRHLGALPERPTAVFCGVLVLGALVVREHLLVRGAEYQDQGVQALTIIVSAALTGGLVVVRRRLVVPVVAWLGQFAFTIYLLHVFGAAGARIALGHLGLETPWLVFCTSVVLGVALPVIFQLTAGRTSWVSWAFLGQGATPTTRLQPRPSRTASPPPAPDHDAAASRS